MHDCNKLYLLELKCTISHLLIIKDMRRLLRQLLVEKVFVKSRLDLLYKLNTILSFKEKQCTFLLAHNQL